MFLAMNQTMKMYDLNYIKNNGNNTWSSCYNKLYKWYWENYIIEKVQ